MKPLELYNSAKRNEALFLQLSSHQQHFLLSAVLNVKKTRAVQVLTNEFILRKPAAENSPKIPWDPPYRMLKREVQRKSVSLC